MFTLNSNITIGQFQKIKPTNVKITKSVYQYVETATVIMPASAYLRFINKDEFVTKVQTADQFKEGDAVNIQLGYNDDLRTEFVGFVSRINYKQSLEVECEGYSYVLRQRTYSGTFSNIELREVLKKLTEGTGIILDTNIPSFPIDKIVFAEKSGLEILEGIKKDSFNTMYFFFTGNILSASLLFLDNKNFSYLPKGDVNYRIGYNVIREDNLEKRDAINADVTVNVLGTKKMAVKIR